MDPADRLLDLLDAWQVAFDRGEDVPPTVAALLEILRQPATG